MSYEQGRKLQEELISSSPLLGGIQDKFRNALNHVKYGWTVQIKPSFNSETIVHFLGKQYKELKENEVGDNLLSLEEFSDDFASCLWFTYRTNFEPIPINSSIKNACCKKNFDLVHNDVLDFKDEINVDDQDTIFIEAIELNIRPIKTSRSFSLSSSVPLNSSSASSPSENISKKIRNRSDYNNSDGNLTNWSLRTSDCGWGCMLRSVQMLLAHSILRHTMGNHYRAYARGHFILNEKQEVSYRSIIRLFGDSTKSPFSIHKFLLLSNKPAGSWFGPNTAANMLVNAMISAKCDRSLFLNDFELYVANDRVIVREQLFALFKQNYSKVCDLDSKHFYSVKHTAQINCDCKPSISKSQDASILLIIPMKLGCSQKIDIKLYGDALKVLMNDPCFVGLVGGKPNRSVFIAGYQDNKYIYFEPHIKQTYIDTFCDNFSLKSFSCFVPQMARFERLDSSLAIGYLFKSINEVNAFFQRLKEIKPKIFEVVSVKDRSVSKKESTVGVIDEVIDNWN